MAQPAPHPDFEPFAVSWELSLRADGYAPNTLKSYGAAVRHVAGWLAEHHPDTGPLDVTRGQVRSWLVHIRDTRSSGTARSWFAGVRHFLKWLVAEGETTTDPSLGIRSPGPNEAKTPVVSGEDIRKLLATCAGTDFVARRDRAIILLFVDGGLRLAELAKLTVDAVDIRERIVYVAGKGANRSGVRHRAVPVGIKCAQALDRYLRERRKHVYADSDALWLGGRNRASLGMDGIGAMLERRAARAGMAALHPHMFRHTWASGFRGNGGSEGDLMVLGGWRSRAMLDRYGRAAAEDRARESYRKRSLGDRL
jgi:site-specific recombinase XerD